MTTKDLQDQLVNTLQATISKVGPLPNSCGEKMRLALSSENVAVIAAVGVLLEKAVEANNYEKLVEGLVGLNF